VTLLTFPEVEKLPVAPSNCTQALQKYPGRVFAFTPVDVTRRISTPELLLKRRFPLVAPMYPPIVDAFDTAMKFALFVELKLAMTLGPLTVNRLTAVVVPTHTFPLESTRMRSEPAVANSNGNAVPVPRAVELTTTPEPLI
jgi:hypothetical protein